MTRRVGLSVGATNLAAVIPGCAALTRQPAVTLERGVVVTDFVDRAADPVGVLAVDGTLHRGETLIASALRGLTYAVASGRAPMNPPAVTHPAHWRPAAVAALRRELSLLPEWRSVAGPMTVVSDAAAAVTALQADPGLPTRGVIALCDFGGTGTSITLVDAADGYRPIGPTLRHSDFSGEFIDRALLAHVIGELSITGAADIAGTAAIGSLHRMRTECRAAKERLSRAAVTTLFADVPGYRGEVRLTRAELDDEIRHPLRSVVEVLQDHLARNRIHPADLAAVASVGGGANIPAVTTVLSEQLRVPVITTPRPELTAAEGAALLAARRPEDDSVTAVASPVQSATMRAIAWSEVDDVPEVVSAVDDSVAGASAARPVVDFLREQDIGHHRPRTDAWYRPILVTAGVFAAMVLAGTGAVMAIRNDAAAMTGSTPTTTIVQPGPPSPAAAQPSELSAAPEQPGEAPSYVQAAPAPQTRVVISTPPPVVVRAPASAVAPPPADAPPPPVEDPPPPPSTPPASTPTATSPTSTAPPSSPPSSPPSNPPSSPPQSQPPSSPPSSPPSQPPHSEPPAPPAHEEPPAGPADQPQTPGDSAAE